MAIVLLLVLPALLLICLRFRNVVQPGWTYRRKLPHPVQEFWLTRLFHEPSGFELEKWSRELPHEGLIRYFGVLNEERIYAVSLEAVKGLLGSGTYKFIKPKLQNELSANVAGRGLVNLEGQEHREVKKILQPAFKGSKIDDIYPIAWGNVQQSAKGVAKGVDTDGRVKPLRHIQAASLETIGKWAFSKDLGALSEPQTRFARLHIGMLRSTKRGAQALTLASIIGLNNMMSLPLRAVRTLSHTTGHIRSDIDRMVASREQTYQQGQTEKEEHQPDFLDTLISSHKISHEHIVDQSLHFLAAAAEMPAIMTSWALHLLSRHPEAQTRLRTELQENMSKISDDPKTLEQLPYLNAVLEETVRVHHLDTVLWREVAEPTTLVGYPMSPGLKVVWSPWVMNRDEQSWGADAHVFRPERWLEASSEEKRSEANATGPNVSFGIGPRRCIGEQYGRAVVRCMVAGFLQELQFSPKDIEQSTNVGLEIGISPPIAFFKVLDGWEIQAKHVRYI